MGDSLIQKIRKGSTVAFKELYQSHFNAIRFYAEQYLYSKEEARDVAQDTFVSLWNHRKELDDSQSIKAYIFTVARNKCLNILRKRASEKDYGSSRRQQEAALNYWTLCDTSAEKIMYSEVEQLLNSALKELPEQHRNVFEMSRKKGMTYNEIAKVLGLSVKTVEYRMMHVLQVLRYRLKDYLVGVPVFWYFSRFF